RRCPLRLWQWRDAQGLGRLRWKPGHSPPLAPPVYCRVFLFVFVHPVPQWILQLLEGKELLGFRRQAIAPRRKFVRRYSQDDYFLLSLRSPVSVLLSSCP